MFIKKIYSNIYAHVCVCVCVCYSLSHVQLFASLWTVTLHAPLYMGFSRQEYWSGLPLTSPGDLLDPRIEPGSLTLQADSLLSEPPWKPIYAHISTYISASMYDNSPGGGNGNPLQYSCLENPMDREASWATVQRVAKSWTGLRTTPYTYQHRH